MILFLRGGQGPLRGTQRNRCLPCAEVLDDRTLLSGGLTPAQVVAHDVALLENYAHRHHYSKAQTEKLVTVWLARHDLSETATATPTTPPPPVVTVTVPPTTITSPTPTPTSTANVPVVSGVEAAEEQEIVDLVNQQRIANGLAPLQVNTQLVQAAQIQAAQMAQLDDMDHDLPTAPLPTLEDRLDYVGYNYESAGENIAVGFTDANSVMTAWMNSPGHRANILDPSYTDIGVGIAYDSAGTAYFCQEFGQPMPSTYD